MRSNKREGQLLKNIFLLIFLCASLSATVAYAQSGNISVGKVKSSGCTRCHGENGISSDANYPNLAGQQEQYLAQALKDYKYGKRNNSDMKAITDWLSETNINDLAAYYSSIKITIIK